MLADGKYMRRLCGILRAVGTPFVGGRVTLQSEVAPLRSVLLKHARDAFVDPARIGEQWAALNYSAAPELDAACRESDALAALLEELGVALEWMPAEDTGLDSIYVRDASVVCDAGVVLCRMGKGARADEPAAQGRFFEDAARLVHGAISGTATLEGGDVVWLDGQTVAVGRGYRTNEAGIGQLADLVADDVEVVPVPLPHYHGPADVFHLMSMLSPLADDLVLVYSPLLPVPFRELLLERGLELIEVPDEEFDTIGSNVLAVAPRVAIALDGSPETRRRMEAAGVTVHTYTGVDISVKGRGGPTCLTRPLERGV